MSSHLTDVGVVSVFGNEIPAVAEDAERHDERLHDAVQRGPHWVAIELALSIQGQEEHEKCLSKILHFLSCFVILFEYITCENARIKIP